MADFVINKLTDEQLEHFRKTYPEAPEPDGPWELVDGKIRIGFYATEKDAQEAQKRFETENEAVELFEDWVDETAAYLKISSSDLEKILRGHLR